MEVIDFHQTKEVKGVKFTAYAAGHVLGAAMFEIDIEGVKILYTGDYSMEVTSFHAVDFKYYRILLIAYYVLFQCIRRIVI